MTGEIQVKGKFNIRVGDDEIRNLTREQLQEIFSQIRKQLGDSGLPYQYGGGIISAPMFTGNPLVEVTDRIVEITNDTTQ